MALPIDPCCLGALDFPAALHMLIFVGAFLLMTSVFVPDTLLALYAGATYGLGVGLALVLGAGLVSAAAQYGLSRTLLRPRIERELQRRPSLDATRRAVLAEPLRLQVLLRLTPLYPPLISYLLGASGVRFRGFVLACFAMAPLFFVEVYAGAAGRTIAGRAASGEDTGWMQDVILILGLVAAVLVLVLVVRAARRAVNVALAELPAGSGREHGGA